MCAHEGTERPGKRQSKKTNAKRIRTYPRDSSAKQKGESPGNAKKMRFLLKTIYKMTTSYEIDRQPLLIQHP
jgi:hypothetical protein